MLPHLGLDVDEDAAGKAAVREQAGLFFLKTKGEQSALIRKRHGSKQFFFLKKEGGGGCTDTEKLLFFAPFFFL
jgi:hypothetical protein